VSIRINNLLKENNMTIWQLYKLSGIPKSTLCKLISSPLSVPHLPTLLHICEGFGISIREFFDDPIFDETEQD